MSDARGQRLAPSGRSVLASAPVRIADIGGWTDTWFAEYGLVCNVAIERRVAVRVDIDHTLGSAVEISTHIDGRVYTIDPVEPPGWHPMIEAVIRGEAPTGGLRIEITHDVAAGSGLGGSAALGVALVAGLCAAGGERLVRGEVARRAHRYELAAGRESGVQDHWAAAFGGINRLAVDYPSVRREEVRLAPGVAGELGRRLHTVVFGSPHDSSALHSTVLSNMMSEAALLALDRIRDAAHLACVALPAGDLDAYGAALTSNHAALVRLHPDLVGDDARRLEGVARQFRARGWKVNGAGGQGGSMVVLGPADAVADGQLCEAIREQPGWTLVGASLALHGVVARCFDPDAMRSGRVDPWFGPLGGTQ